MIKLRFRSLLREWRETRERKSRFRQEFLEFKAASLKDTRFEVSWESRHPCLADRTESTPFDRHYLYHPAWAARVVRQVAPARHVDISSSLSFVSLVSAWLPVDFYDYRVPDLHLEGLTCKRADLRALAFQEQSIESLSCMHVIEHVGLGRYGDPIDPQADWKAVQELVRVTKPGGSLLLVVPVAGKSRVEFNAHRVYRPELFIEMAGEQMSLSEFTLIPDQPADGHLVSNPPQSLIDRQRYGCGCFWFKKKTT